MSSGGNTVQYQAAKSILFSKTKSKKLKKIIENWQLYVFFFPALVYFIIFSYGPMYGVQIAFKDFIITKGIWASEWVGLKHIIDLFSNSSFWGAVKNTVSINVYALIAGFPIPIILALLLNEVRNNFFQRFVQNVTYAPYFISNVVMAGMIILFLNTNGITNKILMLFGLNQVHFLMNEKLFYHIFVWSGIWQNAGCKANA